MCVCVYMYVCVYICIYIISSSITPFLGFSFNLLSFLLAASDRTPNSHTANS